MKKIITLFVTFYTLQLSFAQRENIEIGMQYGYSSICAITDYESPVENNKFHISNGFRFGIFADFHLKKGLELSTNINVNEKKLEFSPSSSTDYLPSFQIFDLQVGLKTRLTSGELETFIRPFVGGEYLSNANTSYGWDYILICGTDPISSYFPEGKLRKFNLTTGLGLGMEYHFPRGISIAFQPEIGFQISPAIKSSESPYMDKNHRFLSAVYAFSISKKI